MAGLFLKLTAACSAICLMGDITAEADNSLTTGTPSYFTTRSPIHTRNCTDSETQAYSSCENGGYCTITGNTDDNTTKSKCHCPSNYTGKRCESSSRRRGVNAGSVYVIVGVAAAVFIVIVIVIAAIIWYKRRKSQAQSLESPVTAANANPDQSALYTSSSQNGDSKEQTVLLVAENGDNHQSEPS